MDVLLINPPEYTFEGFHNVHTYPTELYNWATHYKSESYNVHVLDMYPELVHSKFVTNVGGDIYYDGIKMVYDTGVVRKCGNYENEKRVKGVIRTGFPNSILEESLSKTKYSQIIICAMGSKTGVTSSSWAYVFMGVKEVIDICKKYQPESQIIVMGEYAKISPEAAKLCGADMVIDYPSPGRHFIDTDITLFDKEVPNRINIATSYGCGNACGFCFIQISESTSRHEKSVEDTLRYIGKLYSMGHKKYRIVDSNLLANWDSHMKPILEGIVARGWDVDITSYGGVEPALLTEDMASLMVSAGFSDINVPLDNPDPEILKMWGGSKTTEAWVKASAIAKKHFKNVHSYVMMGYPGQKHVDIMKSVQMCGDSGTIPAILPFVPIPGTIYDEQKRNPEELHPLLFPYASNDFTSEQMDDMLDSVGRWYTKSTIKPEDTIQTKRIYTSSPAIPIK